MTAKTSELNALFFVRCRIVCAHKLVGITQMQKPNANSQDAADQTICKQCEVEEKNEPTNEKE